MYSIFRDLKKIAKKAKIRSSRKLPDIRYSKTLHSEEFPQSLYFYLCFLFRRVLASPFLIFLLCRTTLRHALLSPSLSLKKIINTCPFPELKWQLLKFSSLKLFCFSLVSKLTCIVHTKLLKWEIGASKVRQILIHKAVSFQGKKKRPPVYGYISVL